MSGGVVLKGALWGFSPSPFERSCFRIFQASVEGTEITPSFLDLDHY